MKNRTKIICTIGPASSQASTLVSMVRAGMDVARLNLSHGTHASHKTSIRNIRAAAKKANMPVAILADLQGPKIRLGELPEVGVMLKRGEQFTISTVAKKYQDGVLPVTYRGLARDVKKGNRILIDDGLIEVVVTGVAGELIRVKVVNGGNVTSHKGMNFPDSTLRLSSITAKDKADVAFAVGQGVEWIALSFVIGAQDIQTLRKLIQRAGKKGQTLPRVIAKIEKHEAVKHFSDILSEADGIMVARGDLGVEIPAEDVPVHQKEMIDACRKAGKPVVVATQMLDSMIRNPRPTRAEVSDVANAVFDHTDAVMLSGESATGRYPLQAVKMMAKILQEAEASPFDDVSVLEGFPNSVFGSMAYAIKVLALSGHIDGVASFAHVNHWGETLLMSRPEIPLFFFAGSETEARQANIRWGVQPLVMSGGSSLKNCAKILTVLKKNRLVNKGARLAVVCRGEHGIGFNLVDVE